MGSLQDVVSQVLSGERDAYARIVAAYQEELLAYAASRVPNADFVDEVVQRTFVRAYEQLSLSERDKDMGAWLRAICRFMILAELKRCARDVRNQAGYREYLRYRVADTLMARRREEDEDVALARDALGRCLERLEERYQMLMDYRYMDRMTVAQMGRRLGRPARWVTVTLYRIRRMLRTCMRQHLHQRTVL